AAHAGQLPLALPAGDLHPRSLSRGPGGRQNPGWPAARIGPWRSSRLRPCPAPGRGAPRPSLAPQWSPLMLALMLIADIVAGLDAIYPDLDALYRDLHQHPELSQHEEKTAAKMSERLRKLGFEVLTGVGGTGVVGVLRNGQGPVVLLRTDMDALPVEEKTGLPYSSKVPEVMHACGHDIHMTSWVGAATLLSQAKDRWRGTLIFLGQ